MKLIFAIIILTISSISFADCKDPNLRGIKSVDFYGQLQYLKRFTKVAEVSSAAPAGLDYIFGEGKELCKAITATYLTHNSGTEYILFTTHDDYCDGGNTIGAMINMDQYLNEGDDVEDSVVAIVSDSEFSCKSK